MRRGRSLNRFSEDGRPYRTGFFLGDGTGAGKGRQVAAIILDQWLRGRRKQPRRSSRERQEALRHRRRLRPPACMVRTRIALSRP
ncbi:strawberry notch-like NTP hydrolase domain-containing protein [Sphingomonas sp. STIS6.2]|uniref:strawberry notch-like NTP hydrolase domain-containing protein n=1 Tax=Sphingomonas sp. STIS6.2 TaxID=1379700 RepID=UPI0022788968|nr:strawberry notch family protein [Sphingomonas sp. STIS6.2]